MKFNEFAVVKITFFVIFVYGIFCDNEDGMDDFPLDTMNDQDTNTVNSSSRPEINLMERKAEMFNQIMTSIMKKPEAREKLSQVLPIIRSMSPEQRFVLSAIVMKQISGSENGSNNDLMNQYGNNTSDLMLPISMDIASMFKNLASGESPSGRSAGYGAYFHNPLQLGYRIAPQRPLNPYKHHVIPRRRSSVPPEMTPPPIGTNSNYEQFHDWNNKNEPLDEDNENSSHENNNEFHDNDLCDENLCTEDAEYPESKILDSLGNKLNVFKGLEEISSDSHDGKIFEVRRQGLEDLGEDRVHICESKVRYTRPKRARSVNGQWKYIVNTGKYTQTLRVENCVNTFSSCSFLKENVKSQCAQVYNYHRLLTWDQTSGLAMDVFKVPSCCSCEIQNVLPIPFKKYGIKYDNHENEITDDSPIFPHTNHQIQKQKVRNRIQQHSTPKRDLLNDNLENRPNKYITTEIIRRNAANTSYDRKGEGKIENALNVNPTKKVNYNYHPIIDFFKTTPKMNVIEKRMDNNIQQWTPITEGVVPAPK